ncbi:hypothetical protein [Flavivirga sp. 57AJ16]|uniref:hypothetical protein n=1 Tax=Flavivirga sp. 57AJ16 TaxID=3025307 RepID=UPI00308232D1
MNYTQLSQYINGKKISIDFLTKIIQEFPDADLNWLLRNDDVLREHVEPYKATLTNQQIIDKIEVLLGDLKERIKEEE